MFPARPTEAPRPVPPDLKPRPASLGRPEAPTAANAGVLLVDRRQSSGPPAGTARPKGRVPPRSADEVRERVPTMPRFDVRLSPEGKRELEDELQRLEGNRPGIAARLAQARDQANDPT